MLNQMIDFLLNCWPSLILTALTAYLLGSLNSAIIVTKLFSHSDIRDSGSGNAGATNVLRSQGKLPALFTTVGDLGKSIAAVFIGGFLVSEMNGGYIDGSMKFVLVGKYLAGLFCIIGHIYPLYFGFRGGKGVLTTLGMMIILDWRVALICLGVFIIIVLIFRMVSLGSISAVFVLPILTGIFSRLVDGNSAVTTLFCIVMTTFIALILILKHIPNIKRIINGTESKLGSKK
ncbi:MAG: glycerol-3-phosphate 1-O-acyltransferase PlsY [Oscillospiraceae bacterium]|nr:glycerol-3-phosphate 1-O-acyltransferase PlsY [Oscillospiraceae bacterium]MDD4413857.1 glycerol-3-phosphate 1-O-acyltransferase PlsY [Oscillospiraceae bacterium]